jgi:hypothetical protein
MPSEVTLKSPAEPTPHDAFVFMDSYSCVPYGDYAILYGMRWSASRVRRRPNAEAETVPRDVAG